MPERRTRLTKQLHHFVAIRSEITPQPAASPGSCPYWFGPHMRVAALAVVIRKTVLEWVR